MPTVCARAPLPRCAASSICSARGACSASAIESGRVPNMIFYGPSGVGKTTVARIIAENSGMRLHKLNGTTRGHGGHQGRHGRDRHVSEPERRCLLYLDEIQYLNKKQQQSLLECMEDGNDHADRLHHREPVFLYLQRAALPLQRCLSSSPSTPAGRAAAGWRTLCISWRSWTACALKRSRRRWTRMAAACGGDMRKALGSLESAVAGRRRDGRRKAADSGGRAARWRSAPAMRYDQERRHATTTCISALQKSIRGSDPDAAVHYLARILEAGDLLSACRQAAGHRGGGRGPCVPAGHPHREGLRGQRPAAGPAGGAPAAGGRGRAAGHRAQKQFGAQRHPGRASRTCAGAKPARCPASCRTSISTARTRRKRGRIICTRTIIRGHWVKQQYLPDALAGVRYYEYGQNKNEQAAKAYWDKIKK